MFGYIGSLCSIDILIKLITYILLIYCKCHLSIFGRRSDCCVRDALIAVGIISTTPNFSMDRFVYFSAIFAKASYDTICAETGILYISCFDTIWNSSENLPLSSVVVRS
jgi:hypothetical protein